MVGERIVVKSPHGIRDRKELGQLVGRNRPSRRMLRAVHVLLSHKESPIGKSTAQEDLGHALVEHFIDTGEPASLIESRLIMRALNPANPSVPSDKEQWGDWLYQQTSEHQDELPGIVGLPQLVIRSMAPGMDFDYFRAMQILGTIGDINAQRLAQIGQLFDTWGVSHIHVKPTYSAQMHGHAELGSFFDRETNLASLLAASEALIDMDSPLKGDLILQPHIPHTYMRYKGVYVPGENGEDDTFWRVTEKFGYRIEGGHGSVLQQIMASKELSLRAKLVLLASNRKRLFEKPETDVTLHVDEERFHSINSMPADPKTLAEIEPTMLILIRYLRKTFGDIRHFCFDVGITEDNQIAIFEYQEPSTLRTYDRSARRGKIAYRNYYKLVAQQTGEPFVRRLIQGMQNEDMTVPQSLRELAKPE